MKTISFKNKNNQIFWSITINDDNTCSFWDTVPQEAVPLLEKLGFKEKEHFVILEKRLQNKYTIKELKNFLCG